MGALSVLVFLVWIKEMVDIVDSYLPLIFFFLSFFFF